MTILDSLQDTADGAADSAKTYMNSTEGYFKLQVFKHMALFMTFTVKALVVGGLALIALTFFSICGVLLLSQLLESTLLACALVGGVFLLLAVIVYVKRKAIDQKILNNLSKQF